MGFFEDYFNPKNVAENLNPINIGKSFFDMFFNPIKDVVEAGVSIPSQVWHSGAAVGDVLTGNDPSQNIQLSNEARTKTQLYKTMFQPIDTAIQKPDSNLLDLAKGVGSSLAGSALRYGAYAAPVAGAEAAVGVKAAETVGGKILSGAASGAKVGGFFGALQPISEGNYSLKDIAKSAAEMGVTGGVLGGAVPTIHETGKSVFTQMGKNATTVYAQGPESLANKNKAQNQANSSKYVEDVMTGKSEALRLDQPKILQQTKDYQANKLDPKAEPTTTVTIYRAGKGDVIGAGDHVTLDAAKAESYSKQRNGSKVTSTEVPLKDLVQAGGTKSEFIYAPKEAIKIEPTPLSPAPAKPIVETYKIAEELKPVQSKLERMVKTRQRWQGRLASEINNLSKQGKNASLKELNKTVNVSNLNDKFAVNSTHVAEQIKPNSPQSITDINMPGHLTVKQANSLRRSLNKEYGAEGTRGIATDVINGGYRQLMDLNPGMDLKTAKHITNQILKDPTVIPSKTKLSNVGPSKKEFRDFVGQLVKMESKDILKLKKKIATRENKLGPIMDQIAQMSDQLRGVTSTREAAIKEGKSMRRAGVEEEAKRGILKVLKDAPKDVIDHMRTWVNARAATELEGVKAKREFKSLDSEGLAAFDKVQSGVRTGEYGKLHEYFTKKYNELKSAGIGQRFQANYLPQLWADDAATVNKVMGTTGSRISEKPGFTMQKVISSYQKGIELGLTPKYKTISELVGWYEHTANRAMADKAFLNKMKESGRIIESAKAPSGWKSINPDYMPGQVYKAEPAIADAINNYLGRGNALTEKTANVVGRVKGIVLGAGIPWTGLNFHGVSIFTRDLLGSKNPLKSGLSTTAWLAKPSLALKYFNENFADAVEYRKKGLVISSEEHVFDRKAREATGNIAKDLGGKASDLQQKLFEDPLFGKVMPALKLKYAKGITEDLMSKGMSRDEAMKVASKSANDVYGGINYDQIFRDKTFQQIARTFLLAPDWLETQARVGGNVAKGAVKLNDPQLRQYRRIGRNLMIGYVAANIINKQMSGHYMFQNDPKDQWSIDTGTVDAKGNKRLIKVFGGAVDFAKLPYEVVQGLASGDPSIVGNILRGRLSSIAGSGVSLLTNTNPAKGNTPIFGPDKYGKLQTAGTQLGNLAGVTGSSVLPSPLQNFSQTLQGKNSLEQGLTGLVEAPITYRKPKTGKISSNKGSGIKKVKKGTSKIRVARATKSRKVRSAKISRRTRLRATV